MAHASDFGGVLRENRLGRGLTQEQLAERARISTRTVSDLERGVAGRARPETARLLANALGLESEARFAFLAKASGAAPGTDPNGIAGPLTQLVGREADLEELVGLLRSREHRVVTLVGAAGVGKTTLAQASLARLRDAHDWDGVPVWLADIEEPDLLGSAVARALGVRERRQEDVDSALAARLRASTACLFLDNAEHLVDAVGGWLCRLLPSCPSVTVLVTSRVPLRLRMERVQVVSPLPLPKHAATAEVAASPAVSLFLLRARAVGGLGLDDVGAVGELCRRLDGLPLAIELAAARTRALSPRAILDRHRALPMLAGGPRDFPARHQTLRQAIDWSYDLLDESGQQFFRLLSVFVGGFTVEGAVAMAAEEDEPIALEALASLVEGSLVQVQEIPGGDVRYAMLQTVREYAFERLHLMGQATAAMRRHARIVAQLVEQSRSGLTGRSQVDWLRRLDAEYANICAAMRWAQENDASILISVAASLWRYWEVRGRLREGRDWLDKALSQSADVAPAERARALRAHGSLAYHQGEYDVSAASHAESVRLCEELREGFGVAAGQINLGNVAAATKRPDDAVRRYERGLALFADLGDHGNVALAQNNLGEVVADQGRYREAVALFRASVSGYSALGDSRGLAMALHGLGVALRGAGHPSAAVSSLRRSLEIRVELGEHEGIAECMEALAAVGATAGEPLTAAHLVGAAAAIRADVGEPVPPQALPRLEAAVAAARAAVGPGQIRAAMELGSQLSVAAAVSEAISLAKTVSGA